MTLAEVDTGKLVELVWAAALAGLVVTAAFALAILGLTRVSDTRRGSRSGPAAALYLTLGVVAALAFVGGVAFGVSIIVSK